MFSLSYSKLNFKEFQGLGSFQFLVFFRRLLIYTFLSVYLSEKIGLSTTELTLMASLPMIVSALSQSFLWGPLLDKVQKSHIFIILGEVVAAVLHLLMYYLHNNALQNGTIKLSGYMIIFSLVIIEFPWSASNVGWSALISEKTNNNERTKLMAQLSVIGGLGGIFGAQIGGYLYKDGLGFSEGKLFIIAAIVMIISSIVLLFSVKSEMNRSLDKNNSKLNVEKFHSLYPDRRYPFYLYLVSLVFIVFGTNGVWLIVNLFLAEDSGFNAGGGELALFQNVRSISVMIGGLLLSSKYQNKDDWAVLKLGALFSVIGLFVMIIAPTLNVIFIAAFFLGIQMVMVQSSSYGIAAQIIPTKFRGQLFGYYNSVFFLSFGLAGTFFFGPLVDITNFLTDDLSFAYRLSFFTAILLILIGIKILDMAKYQIEKLELKNND